MNSTIQFTCPHCSHQIQLPSSTVGKQGKCPGCGQVVTITAGAAQMPPVNPAAQNQPVLVKPVDSPPTIPSSAPVVNPPAAPAIPEPVTQTTEPVPASPPVPTPVVQERFETPVIETGGSPTAQPEPQSVPSSLPMSAKPNGRKKLLLIGGIAGGVVLLLTIITVVVIFGLFPDTPGSTQRSPNTMSEGMMSELGEDPGPLDAQDLQPEKDQPPSEKEKLELTLRQWIKGGKAYEPGNYAQGQIPEGVYAYIPQGTSHYYSETDLNGNIIDNEGFDSFGYVYVNDIGNIETKGLLVARNALEKSEYNNAKRLFEVLKGVENYNFSGYYSVGKDIPAGKYRLTSVGEGFVSIESGPIGNSETVDNDIFKGSLEIKVKEGQYLKLSKVKFVYAGDQAKRLTTTDDLDSLFQTLAKNLADKAALMNRFMLANIRDIGDPVVDAENSVERSKLSNFSTEAAEQQYYVKLRGSVVFEKGQPMDKALFATVLSKVKEVYIDETRSLFPGPIYKSLLDQSEEDFNEIIAAVAPGGYDE